MGPQAKTVGGGPATGLADDFVNFLRGGLTTGTFGNPGQQAMGANPIGSTTGIAGILNTILSQGAGKMGGALQDIINQRQAGDIANLRARYGMGGTGTGTPGAYAESLYRSQAAPQAAVQIGQLQSQYLQPLMQAMYGLSERGIPQATTVLSQSPFMQLMSGLGGAGMGAGSIMRALGVGGGGGGGGIPSADQLGITMPDLSGVPPFDPTMFNANMMGANRTQSNFGGF